MRTDLRIGAAVVALLLAPDASAGDVYANAPFRDAPVQLAQAAALERLTIFARAIAATPPGVEEAGDADEGAAGGDDDGLGPLADFALVRGSLAAAAPDAEERLAAVIDTMTEGGDDAREGAAQVAPLVDEARGKLLPVGVTDAAPFRAALMASLSLDEGRVAEGYEEAVGGEAMAYAVGFFALQRVKALWEGLSSAASPEQAADVGEMLAMLDALFPGATRPETLSADPEQAEAPAQQLVGLLEAVTDADLYPGRDIGGAAARVHDIAVAGCEALDVGKSEVGLETLTIAAAYYGATVADTLAVLAPDAAGAVVDGLEAVQEGDPAAAADACPPLLGALAAGERALLP